jgi:hypothetical protein
MKTPTINTLGSGRDHWNGFERLSVVLFCSLLAILPHVASGQEVKVTQLPDFIDIEELRSPKFECLQKEVKYSAADQKYIDILWDESIRYLNAYAIALTTSTTEGCHQSDEAIWETVDGVKRMCIMDQRDMQLMVKHIFQVVHNPTAAKKCFSAQLDVDWIYNPGGELEAKSEVAQWAKRTSFETFFETKVNDPEVKALGKELTDNFYEMVTGDEIKLPANFPYDISARALPNLWAAAGWFPMYAPDSPRNNKNDNSCRGGYAYAEIFGHWGLLRIDKINGEKVGAEVGMTVQAVNSFYPYHNHGTSEIYYAMRQPACLDQFQSFTMREGSPRVELISENDKERVIEFESGMHEEYKNWGTTAFDHQPLQYFHQNTIHAFKIRGDCEEQPLERAFVTVWARSNAHDLRNDYGTTLLCECADSLGTPPKRGDRVRCNLTKWKW